MAYRATVADLLFYDNHMESLSELDRTSLLRAIEHNHGGRRQPDAFDSRDINDADARGYKRGFAAGKEAGRIEAAKELQVRKN